MTSRATIWRANQLRQYHHIKKMLARQEGLEPPTYCLEGSCSIQLSYWRISDISAVPIVRNRRNILMERVMGIEPTRPAWKAGVLPLNYTRVLNSVLHYTLPELICQEFFLK